MTFRLACTLLLTVACLPAAAEDAVARAPKAPPYVLKNRSVFTSRSDDTRAPFSPIGWTKRKPVAAVAGPERVVAAPRIVLDEHNFKVSSILVGNPSLAIINGRTYSEGEFLRTTRTAVAATAGPLPAGVRVRVYRISDGAVVLQNQDQLLTIALARPELLQRTAVEDLLLEDRP